MPPIYGLRIRSLACRVRQGSAGSRCRRSTRRMTRPCRTCVPASPFSWTMCAPCNVCVVCESCQRCARLLVCYYLVCPGPLRSVAVRPAANPACVCFNGRTGGQTLCMLGGPEASGHSLLAAASSLSACCLFAGVHQQRGRRRRGHTRTEPGRHRVPARSRSRAAAPALRGLPYQRPVRQGEFEMCELSQSSGIRRLLVANPELLHQRYVAFLTNGCPTQCAAAAAATLHLQVMPVRKVKGLGPFTLCRNPASAQLMRTQSASCARSPKAACLTHMLALKQPEACPVSAA